MDSLAIEAPRLLSQFAPDTIVDVAALAAVGVVTVGYLLREYTWDKPDPNSKIYFERPQAQEGFINRTKITRNIAERLEELGKNAVVFWGSQSGTSEAFANRLTRELRQRFGLEALAADLSDFDAHTIGLLPESKIAIFILSTYGEGDPSDNAGAFWDWSTKNGGGSGLSSLRYVALGLGNSQYRYYNRVVDVIDAALQKAGATRLMPVGKADDAQGTTEEDFLAWKDQLFALLVQSLGLSQHEIQYEAELSVREDTSLDLADLHRGEPMRDTLGRAVGHSQIKPVKVREARELFSNTNRNCLHLDLDFTDHAQITYKTGDHLGVWAMNPDEEVDRVIRILGLGERRNVPVLIQAKESGVKVPVPSPTTIETILRFHLEICAPVSRDTAQFLASFAPNETAKAWLIDISKDRDSYGSFVSSQHVNFARLLEIAVQHDQSATWSSLPLSFLIEFLPKLQPRYYSISSSSVISPRVPSITALVSSTPVGAPSPTAQSAIPGLATNYLLGLSHSIVNVEPPVPHPAGLSYSLAGPDNALSGGRLFAHVRRSRFKLPMLSSCPLILVAAGTGIAPFRAFLAERQRMKAIGKDVGEIILFFGCRREDEDYIYREELEEFERGMDGKLRIVTAFSRQEGQAKVYVQDQVRKHADDVARMVIGDDASVYICGRASMAREVGKVLGDIVAQQKGFDDGKTKEWTEQMKRFRKWQEDVWG